MRDVYKNPESHLVGSDVPEFTYGNLGIWRKIYLIINWLGSIFFAVAMAAGIFGENSNDLGLNIVMAVLVVLVVGYAYWLQVAVVSRNVSQLLIIAVLNIVPLVNPISSLIVFAIRSTSKTERGV